MSLRTFAQSEIVLNGGVYYTPGVQLLSGNFSAQATLSIAGTATLQISLDGTNYDDVGGSDITCTTRGSQSYSGATQGVYVRLKSANQITSAKFVV